VRKKLSLALLLYCASIPALAAPPTFSTQRVISAQADLCFDVRTEDVDQDGDLDILSASYDGLIAWWENDGAHPSGPWAKHVVTTFADGAHTVFAKHVDGDADLDFLTATFNTQEVAWFENGSLPNPWQEHPISFDAPFACDIWSADLDGDGDPDVLVNYDGFIDWYEHDGTADPQVWFQHGLAPWPTGSLSVEAADLDDDGDLDVVSAIWFENDGAPDPTFTHRLVSSFPTGGAWNSLIVGDVDRDGDRDIVSAEDNRIAWHENDGGSPPVWTSHSISTAPDMALAVWAADLDGDTDLDVLHASFMDDTIAWYESDGGSPPSFTAHTITTGAWGARSVHAADLDADGDVDVLSGTQRDHDIVWYVNELDPTDTDGDGMRDELDCAPGNATAFAVPGEIRNARFDAAERLTWSAEAPRSGSGTQFDVLRGLIGQLPVGSGPGETCAIQGTAATSLPADAPPAPGTGRYYLVRGKNACGVGSYGFATGGAERTSVACP
jgi:hypothetical protein